MLVVVVIRREKEISLAAIIGMDGHMSNFPVERKFILDPVFLRFSLREFVESHMLMIRLLASK